MKKKKIKKRKITKKRIDSKVEEEKPEKKVVENEEKQLIWFFAIVAVIFLSFLIPYFYIQNLKTFTYAGAEWTKQDAGGFDVYHGRFLRLTNNNSYHNLYLRTDPRENNVPVNGAFGDFKYGGYLSLDRQTSFCKGEVSRTIVDLVDFLVVGVGIGEVKEGIFDEDFANETKKTYVNCENAKDRTVVILKKGEEGSVIQNAENPYCYEITLENCENNLPMEKFMTTIVANFHESN